MSRFLKILFYAVAAVYPVLVFAMLVVFKLPVRILSLCIMILAAAFFLSATAKTGDSKKKYALSWRPLVSSALFLAAGLFCFITQQTIFLKLYSVAISLIFLVAFGSTLFSAPNIIFRFATLMDKTIKGSAWEKQVERYCFKVTIVWCCFFILNGSASVWTAFFASDRVWSIYNGGISYAIMGLIFAVEFIIRKKVDGKMTKVFPISKFKADSREDSHILCYEERYSSGAYKTWKEFLVDTAKLRKYISAKEASAWILHCEDYWYFLVTFIALLQSGKKILLTQNIAEYFIDEIKKEGIEFLTDQKKNGELIKESTFVPDLLAECADPSDDEMRNIPEINPEDSNIFMYTSGSTGAPKAVPQRMKEFEEDNAFIISKWGKEFQIRKLVTTVSQHHIYGFLFGICLPFTLGVPFRRTRIEFPEDFEKLTDDKYIIIATPAFLKRTVESKNELPLEDAWIFTSGGAVSPELAVLTEKVFGFCPLEVYGSTETSGIAYRQQSVDKLVWTPFDNAKVWKGDDGCLRIISPYIKNPEGFATADLVEFTGEGQRFLLKGRSDSIVKIEEKRISMTEVENRLLESGFVEDVKVIALSNEVRQYLAAAVVLNAEGKKKFANVEKYLVNRYFHDWLMKFFENVVLPKKWRFVDVLPVDVQGKKHRNEIAAMFENQQDA
ncbi:AMP-binding protein [Treponema sp.]|uniref:AMP-binding protein n=1 Tax=Treponema sp. TaxID=166 RepID=UPI00298EAF6F|nr:AMP-binding protein [Treponema sp.]MCQ2241367.1 AMP-binding protein [Treponema sp.]